jgi:hypothetical protein
MDDQADPTHLLPPVASMAIRRSAIFTSNIQKPFCVGRSCPNLTSNGATDIIPP